MPIVLQFYPNGEFSQGVDTFNSRPHRHVSKTTQTSKLTPERRDAYLQWRADNDSICAPDFVHTIGSVYRSPSGEDYTLSSNKENSCTLDFCDAVGKMYQMVLNKSIRVLCFEWNLALLVYQSVESSESPESRKKLRSMTKNMARNIRNGVYLMEQDKGGKDCLSFLTLTLPSLSSDGLAKCCEKWDYMVSRFLDWLGTRVKRCNIEFKYVYCTEIQSKRLQQRNEYAPHLHIVFRGRNGTKSAWAITPKQARKAWSACIASVVDESFSSAALENLQRIKYSAARYLSKYLSKGASNLPSGESEETHVLLKTQWGGMARCIARQIKRCTQRLTSAGSNGDMAVGILRYMELLLREGYIKYFKRGYISLGISRSTGLEYGLHIGVGCLRTPTFRGGVCEIFCRLSQICVEDW